MCSAIRPIEQRYRCVGTVRDLPLECGDDMRRPLTLVALPVALLIVAASCASGPSEAAKLRNLAPATTTTTVPLPEGIQLVKILNASFQPSVLELDTTELPTVRWENTDDVEYTIFSRDKVPDPADASVRIPLFESPPIPPGGTWDFDFTSLDLGVYRYFIVRGAQTIPGLVDTRTAQ